MTDEALSASAAAARDVADVHVIEAGVIEAGVIAALQQACFADDPWAEDWVATLLQQPGTFARLLRPADGRDRVPVGFVMARVAAEDAEILAIGVLPSMRRGGGGRALVDAVAMAAGRRGATALFLEVAEDNLAARRLYAATGFDAVGRRPGYYRRADGRVAALVLRRTLRGDA